MKQLWLLIWKAVSGAKTAGCFLFTGSWAWGRIWNAPNSLKAYAVHMVRNGAAELGVSVSFTVYRNWMIKTSHIKGFKPAFQTPELLCTCSGWGPSLCCFSSCLLKISGMQPGEWGQGIWVRTETSPDCLCNSCCAAIWLPALPRPWTGSKAPAVPQPSGHVQLVLCCLIAQCQGVGWWHCKLCLTARRSLGVCRCRYTCNNTFTIIWLLMYTVQSWSSPAWNARQRGLSCSLWWH